MAKQVEQMSSLLTPEMQDAVNLQAFLKDALERYRQKYGMYTVVDNYIIYFEPALGVVKMN